jgi:diguanylate cyclase
VQEAERRADELQAELDRVRALVREDALTGALNRRGLEEMFAREAARAERRGSPLTLCQLDLDDFKSINDHFGHASGDEVLTRFVCSVRRIVRPNDILARCGGDEFVLLLPDAAAEQAVTAVRRLQSEISSRRGATPRINLSFSCGIAIRGRREPLASLMQRADSAMYAAKRRGCNLFEIARPDPLPAPLAAA